MTAESAPPRARFWKAVGGLGLTQIIAWGCVYYPVSVTGPLIARELQLSAGVVYSAYAALLLASAIVAPTVGRAIDRFGGRPVLAIGCVVAALALLATAGAHGLVAYALSNILLGVAAAMTLYDAAFPALVEAAHPQGRRAITLVTFAGGFASTIFWPITAALSDHAGWRGTYICFAIVMLCVCLPLNWLALEGRRRSAAASEGPTPAVVAPPQRPWLTGDARRRTLLLLAGTIAANQVVAAGFLIHIIDFSQQMGAGPREAVGLGMLFGPAQVFGRIGEMVWGARFSALATGRIAALFLPLGLLCVLAAQGSLPIMIVFVLALGLSNGLMTIARGTVALALFGPVGYGATMGQLTVPTLVARAAGPVLFALAIDAWGITPTILVGLAISLLACLGMEAVASIDRQIRQGQGVARD